MTETEKLQHRFFSWFHYNKLDRQCPYCTYISHGSHDRLTHLRNEHPDEWPKFKKHMGLK